MAELADEVDALFGRPAAEGITLALVVQRRGEIVAERYATQPANDFQPAIELDVASTSISWSMAKSITHAAVGVLVRDGLVDLAAPAPVPEWVGTPKEQITTLDLLEMRSGLQFVEEYVETEGAASNCLEMLFGDSGPSHAHYAAEQPLVAPPGQVWNYSSGSTNIVARIVGDVVHGSSDGTPVERERSMREFLRDRLFGPVGMTSAEPKFDAAGTFVGSSYVYATARDYARFGELYRHDGVTDLGHGERILPVGWLDHARHQVAVDPDTGLGYGRHWWIWPTIPGSLACHGYEGQLVVVDPVRELVLVHLGKTDTTVVPLLHARVRRMLDAT